MGSCLSTVFRSLCLNLRAPYRKALRLWTHTSSLLSVTVEIFPSFSYIRVRVILIFKDHKHHRFLFNDVLITLCLCSEPLTYTTEQSPPSISHPETHPNDSDNPVSWTYPNLLLQFWLLYMQLYRKSHYAADIP